MKPTRRLTFGQQLRLCLGVFIVNIVLAHLFQTGLFHNLSWLIYGGLFLVHPVLPETWPAAKINPRSCAVGLRIAGGLCILVGLVTRFGI